MGPHRFYFSPAGKGLPRRWAGCFRFPPGEELPAAVSVLGVRRHVPGQRDRAADELTGVRAHGSSVSTKAGTRAPHLPDRIEIVVVAHAVGREMNITAHSIEPAAVVRRASDTQA